MKINVYVKLEIISSSGYISVTDIVKENEIKNNYNDYVDFNMQMKGSKYETYEGYKLRYILLEVEYDGRKRGMSDEDVLKSLCSNGLAIKTGESMFGGFYIPTEKLKTILDTQLTKRKKMVTNGIYHMVS